MEFIAFTDKDDNNIITQDDILQENHYYPFGMNMEGNWTPTIGTPNDYQYNGKELVQDLGLGWNDYGARYYDGALGRFLSVDPLADHPNLVGYSPYVYGVNNPVFHTDPDGKCPPWICGAIAGGLVEVGSQYITNLAKGDSWVDAAKNIDGADVLAATVEGGITGGGSVARRLTITVVSEVAQASIDIEFDGDTDIIGTEGSSKSVGQVATETGIGLVANTAGEFTEAGLKAATNSKATKELSKINRELKKSMKGSQGESKRLSYQANLNSTIKGNNVVSKTVGTITTEVIDEKLKNNQQP